MKHYGFHPEAEAEFLDAMDYYERYEPGLGYDFAIEVHSTIENILSFLSGFPAVRRHCLILGYTVSRV